MGCSKSIKNKCMKSCERYYNNNFQPFAAGETIQLQIAGAKVVDSGLSIETEPNAYTILKTGLYHIVGDVVVNATTGGVVEFSIYKDGVELPCTKKTVTLPTGATSIHTETDLMFTNCCSDINHAITFAFESAAAVGNVIELCTGIMKMA